jgi:CubicO group peptidase (beta-lactamase class C family)
MNNKIDKKLLIICITTILLFGSIFTPITGQIIHDRAMPKEKASVADDLDFDQKINLLMKLGHMPSLSVCVIKNNSVVWSKGYGFYDINNKKKATDSTIYPIGSITKTITATAIMQLYEKGYFDLDDNVSKYLPFDLKNPYYPKVNITFRMLLAHQSSLSSRLGLSIYFSYLNYPHSWLKEYLLPNGHIYSPKIWLKTPPGEGVCYSSTNMEVCAYLVEQMTHQPFDEYCEEHIFQPLDMKNTSWHLANFDINKIAVPYVWRAGIYIKFPIFEYHCYGCGGIWANVLDLSHYLIAYMNDGVYNGTRILKEETVELIETPQYPNSYDGNARYGLGWYFWNDSDGKLYGGHEGEYPGSYAVMIRCISDNTGIIFFFNQFQMFSFNLLHHLSRMDKYVKSQIEKLLFEKADEF